MCRYVRRISFTLGVAVALAVDRVARKRIVPLAVLTPTRDWGMVAGVQLPPESVEYA